MHVAGVVAALLLGAAFLLAGASKIVAGPSWPVQAAALGAPRLVVPFVPWTEIAVGALLVAQVAPLIIGSVAALMLVAFTIAILVRLRAGERPTCACFGAWSATPIGAGHVARNAALLALAIVVVVAA